MIKNNDLLCLGRGNLRIFLARYKLSPKSKLPDGDSEKDSRNFYMMQKIAKLIRVENDKRVEGGRIRSRFFYLKSLLEKDIVNASAQRQTVPRGTQAFRNFTERTNNNYMEKVMRQYRERL